MRAEAMMKATTMNAREEFIATATLSYHETLWHTYVWLGSGCVLTSSCPYLAVCGSVHVCLMEQVQFNYDLKSHECTNRLWKLLLWKLWKLLGMLS